MKYIFAIIAGSLIYMEMVYHVTFLGVSLFNPALLILFVLMVGGFQTLCTGFFREKYNKRILWIWMGLNYFTYASQLVYRSIFKQPLLPAAVTNAGKDAVTGYWREGLHAVLMCAGVLLLMSLPMVGMGVLLHFKKISLKSSSKKERLIVVGTLTGGIVLTIALLLTGYFRKWESYSEYQEFYNPGTVMEQYGILPTLGRVMLGNFLPQPDSALRHWEEAEGPGMPGEGPEDHVSDGDAAVSGSDANNGESEPEEEAVLDTSPNVLSLDFESLRELAAGDKTLEKLMNYIEFTEPSKKNEYTGMFEGYNLIYLTAEGFSPYAVDEQLTPTLYKLIHSGFVVKDYYVPLWQTSTSDGEYVNLTGLIPDQQFSMKRSSANEQPFSLPAYFAKEGVKSYAYHNNSLSYYERHKSHPNLGYDFRASKLGDLPESEWGSHVFQMENAKYWPASDLDMMKATLPEYIGQERFHAYYMTISGHMNYNFSGNKMSSLNKEAVQGLPYSEEGRAYIACNIELDKALQYLIEELEKAGKLEKTVICLSADHYPYGMTIENLEELAGKPLKGSLEIYRNNLILWNSEMETVEVEKTCSALDVLPTLYNLFGFDYDSRLFAGRDILSDSSPLVIFSDRSYVTDRVEYNRKAKSVTPKTEEPPEEDYHEVMKKRVKAVYEFSAGVLQKNLYSYISQVLESGQMSSEP